MKVSFLTFGPEIASSRYRQLIPSAQLQSLGVEVGPGGDILVCAKHGWPLNLIEGYEKVVFDVCDDHFKTSDDSFYHAMIGRADRTVCNSAAMQWKIWKETGKTAHIIPDPYEMAEREPSFGDGLLWFGHESNLGDLYREVPNLKGYKLAVVSKAVVPGITPWSPQTCQDALDNCAVVILPTGRSPCKSANRMIEAIRRGKFVVANPLPAYAEFEPFMWIGDIREGVDWAIENEGEILDRVKAAQDYVRDKYSPETIGKMWHELLLCV